MNLDEYNFILPEELIAEKPSSPRDHCRLMRVDKMSGTIQHDHFYNLPELLREDDLLIVNNSKVFPARLFGEKETTHGKVEILLSRNMGGGLWEVAGRNLKVGQRILFPNTNLQAGVEKKEDETYLVRFNMTGEHFYTEINKIGLVPLPPYIMARRLKNHHEMIDENDDDLYQTVYAKERGSVAAPTAGLHFTPELFEAIEARGISIHEVTLHVGLGTFQPIKTDDYTEHKIHSEQYAVEIETLEMILKAKKDKRRIVAVGTTTTRVLEHLFTHPELWFGQAVNEVAGSTNIYIYPGYHFKCIDAIITNFHLPKSSLLLLTSAFAGKDLIKAAYQTAIEEKYRFYSYGDAMLIE